MKDIVNYKKNTFLEELLKKITRSDFNNLNSESSIIDVFNNVVKNFPEVLAVRDENTYLTFKELDKLSSVLATYINNLKFIKETAIGIHMNMSVNVVVSMLGVLKANCAYVPLDPAYPKKRLEYIINDAQIPLILSSSKYRNQFNNLPNSKTEILDEIIKTETLKENMNVIKSSNLAYILYTSGTTGNPKGVCIEHGSVINFLEDIKNRRALKPGDKCSVWSSFNFDVSVYEIFSSLLEAGTLIIPPDNIRLNIRKFVDWLFDNQIASSYLPPFMLSDILEWGKTNKEKLHLKRILIGVEPINVEIIKDLKKQLSIAEIINGYGPTESTICATLFSCTDDELKAINKNKNVPIGKPISNNFALILDKNMMPVPVGVPGELYIGGKGLARGYQNNLVLTNEKFINISYANDLKIFKTGDLVKWTERGHIEFLNRIDDQIKIRGHRIETSEIKVRIKEIAEVKDTHIVKSYINGNEILIAYVVPFDKKLTSEMITTKLKDLLPSYMVPNNIIFLSRLPITLNGKIDMEILSTLNDEIYIKTKDFLPPTNETQESLLNIWKEVLKTENISINDSFFEVGGHSLLATQIISRVRDLFNKEVHLLDFFDFPTVEKLEIHLSSKQMEKSKNSNMTKLKKASRIIKEN